MWPPRRQRVTDGGLGRAHGVLLVSGQHPRLRQRGERDDGVPARRRVVGRRQRDRALGGGGHGRHVAVVGHGLHDREPQLVEIGPTLRATGVSGRGGEALDLRARAVEAGGGERTSHRQARPVRELRLRQRGQPPDERRGAPVAQERQVVRVHELGHDAGVARLQRVLDRGLDQAAVGEPRRGPARHRRRLLRGQRAPEQLAHEVVAAEPAVVLVQRHHEQVRAHERGQAGGGVVAAEDVVAQLGRTAARGRTCGSGTRVRRAQAGEHLGGEVLRQVLRRQPVGVAAPAQPQAHEVHGGGPALGAGDDRVARRRRRRAPARPPRR